MVYPYYLSNMLYRIKSTENGSSFYLLKSREYTVGRKNCDILIVDDQSISRKHAILTVKNDGITLTDCGAKYNTFLDGTKIEANVETKLKNKSTIRFGMLKSSYKFEEIFIQTTTSSIKSDQKSVLKSNIEFLSGTLQQNWTLNCTHVTVEEIMLTVKVLCAVVKGVPIVTLQYWNDYVSNVQKNLDPPNVTNYVPKCSEIMLDKNISLNYDEKRCQLFKNKVFIFPTNSDKKKMEDIVLLSGGEVESWDSNKITINDIKNSEKEYLIIQITDKLEKLQPSLLELIKYYSTLGKRTIPLQEIALAIINCSCEKDCNANFDRKGIVLAPKSQKEYSENKVLAMSTQSQSQSLAMDTNVKTEAVIPATLESELFVLGNVSNYPVKDDSKDSVEVVSVEENSKNIIETINIEEDSTDSMEIVSKSRTLSIKREGESIDFLSVSKKIKSDSNGDLNFPKKDKINKNETSGKSLFALKGDNNDGCSTSKTINPFSRKRKERDSEVVENPLKKSAFETITIGDSTLSGSTLPNPFANIIKCKNKTQLSNQSSSIPRNIVKEKSTLKKPTANTSIIIDINSVKIDSSKIKAVDSVVESSYSWLTKSSLNETTKRNSTINQSLDEEIMRYIESFRNMIIIEREIMVIKKPNEKEMESTTSNNVNFKKFRKVQPLRIQTTIISESNYRNVICNDKSTELNEVQSDGGESDIEIVQEKPKRGRKYAF